MSSCDLAKVIGGPATITYKGKTFYSKDDIQLSPDLATFLINVDVFGGSVDSRVENELLSLTFVPAGEWENLSVLYPYGTPVIGGSICSMTTCTAVDNASDVVTATNHRLRDGAPVRFSAASGTLISGLVANDLYYVHVLSADTFSVHSSEADALANTSKVALATLGTGDTQVIEQEPLVIKTLSGKVITFFVAAVTQMPDFIGGATQTPLGSVTFEIFRKNGQAASEDAARYSTSTAAFAFDSTFDPAQIVTQPYEASWGTAPWDSFYSKTGWRVSFPIGLAPMENDACGIIGRRLTSVAAEVRGQPSAFSEADILTALKLQGAGAGRGRRIVGEDFDLIGTDVFVRIFGAGLVTAPMGFGSSIDRSGEFVWRNNRKFTAGVPGPVFFVGTAEP